MPYRFTIDQEAAPREGPGSEIQVLGLGVFTNGTTTEISDEQADAFCRANVTIDHEFDKEGRMITRQVIPTIGDLVAGMHGATLEVLSSKSPATKTGPVDSSSSKAPADKEGSS